MTVNELIEYLMDLDQEAEVRIAYQPNYPLQASISNVKQVGTNQSEIDEIRGSIANDLEMSDEERASGEEELARLQESNKIVVYLTEGRHQGYASGTLWEE